MRPHLATLVDDFRKHGRGIAIVNHRGNRRIASTYSELASLVDRFSASLIARNIPSGERVVIWGQNGVEWIATFFGCVIRGVICVPLDAAGSPEFTRRVIQETMPQLIVGDSALLDQLDPNLAKVSFEDFATSLPPVTTPAPVEPALSLDSPLQIFFTSGTTAEPKGVVHTHRNILASIAPIENEIPKYLKYERWVHPLRFLHTLPLSHVFGQFMGLWVPPLLGAEIHFESRLQAQRLIEVSQRERISILASVPRVLALLRDQLVADHPDLPAAIQAAQGQSVWKRWWHFRRIHRTFGYKFWAFVCGGASLPEDIESFWNTLGFVLIQGYGMTETAALITLNHPFKTSRGTIGKVLPGRDVEIRPDGEILVRGDMVSTKTWRGGAIQRSESSWLATGDLASKDEEGRLRFLGRKSQVIVTSSGLNVHPEDVEAALNMQEGVQASAVVPLLTPSGTDPVAILLFRGSRDEAEQAVIAANTRLADFQRIRQWDIWPELDFPRTSTGKIQRHKITEWVNAQQSQTRTGDVASDPLLALILSITHARPQKTGDNARLQEDLQLDSLGRVQLQAALEQKLGLTLGDEVLEQIATFGELRHSLGLDTSQTTSQETPAGSLTSPSEPRHDIYPYWPWAWPIQALRAVFMECVHQPLVRFLASPSIRREAPLHPPKPLLIIGNHVTAYDVPLILYALPRHMRRHIATAMTADLLDDWRKRRNQGSWFLNALGPLTWLLVTALFNVFPLPRSAGFRRSFQHAGEAMDHGYNVIVFPEGRRSDDGTLQAFRPGIGILVNESRVPVLPVALKGLGELKAGHQRWLRSGKLQVIVGSPITFPPNTNPEEITACLHTELARLLDEK
jgi:long-chain acyl-CoA synthetase